ncbi:MAG: NADH-quinone oxidoreductase subunit C [Verrucomicrobia bacterium]|jgi:NADH-quinone oxidoreductase subunit C|nr:NADH-quinone oxidoreductase subunit C [Verrucomicrobiota bacterium]|tara:strand:- start:946 stop:1560 length:615 start_codon:yes stop_codon:yes gene_type:complete
MDEELAQRLVERFAFLSKRTSKDCLSYFCPPENLVELATSLRDREGFEMLVDLTALDWGQENSPRFTTLYHFYSLALKIYLRIACDCPCNDKPDVPSLAAIYPAADWHEREVFDMFGITFAGHPNLKRILMWDEYPYHPLRKEFPLAGIETPLPAPDVVEVTNVSVKPAPMMGGPFVSPAEGNVSESEPRAKDESWTEEVEKTL